MIRSFYLLYILYITEIFKDNKTLKKEKQDKQHNSLNTRISACKKILLTFVTKNTFSEIPSRI